MPERAATLKVFLSHRYKSPEVNLYFFEIFHEFADVYFEVDVGQKPICMTRLERMIQNADAFVGIYPFPDPANEFPTREKLLEASRYFRLEQELALRSCKPALVFYDKRYGGLLEGAPPMTTHRFDFNDLAGGAEARRQQHGFYSKAFCARRPPIPHFRAPVWATPLVAIEWPFLSRNRLRMRRSKCR